MKLFLIIFLFPTIIAAIYFFLISSDKYSSEAKIVIKQTGEKPISLSLGLIGLGNPLSREDALLLRDYILSYDMLDHLDRTIGLRKIYSNPKIDFISRLDINATREDFFKYYKKHVKVFFDEMSGILTVQVIAYSPHEAQRINEAILEQSERYLNGISHKIAQEQVEFIKQELYLANQKIQSEKQKLITFQNKYGVLDPTSEAQAILSIINQLESQLASKEAELKTLLTYLSEHSFQVKAVRSQIASLKKQIEKEKARLVGEDSNKLNRVALEYLNLKTNVDFATDLYKATLSAYETTRVEASRKIKNLVIIQAPTLPEESLYYDRFYNIALVSLASLLLYGILVLIIGIIREHRL